MFRLFLLFVLVPVIELALLIQIGTWIGVWETVALVILTAVVGAYLVRLEGLGVLFRIQEAILSGTFPKEELLDGAMILVAGALFLTPGFLTDILAFLMVFPLTRPWMKALLRAYLRRRIRRLNIHIHRF